MYSNRRNAQENKGRVTDWVVHDRWQKEGARKGLHMLSSGLKPKGEGEETQCWPAGKMLLHQRWEQWLVGACLQGARDIQSRTHAQELIIWGLPGEELFDF